MNDEGFADDLPGDLPPGPREERIVPGLVHNHRGEARAGRVSANKEALFEIGFEKGFGLNDLQMRGKNKDDEH